MKAKLSISVEEELVEDIDDALEDGLFRSRSHFIEYATKQFLEEEK